MRSSGAVFLRDGQERLLAILLFTVSIGCFLAYSWTALERLDTFYRPGRQALVLLALATIATAGVLRPFAVSWLVLVSLPLFGNHPGGRLMELINIPLAASAAGLVWHARSHHRPRPSGLIWFASAVYLTSAVIAIVPTLPSMVVRAAYVNHIPTAIAAALTAPEADPLYSLSSIVLLTLAVAWAVALAWALPDIAFAKSVFRGITCALLVVVAVGIPDFHGLIKLPSIYLLRVDPRPPDFSGFQSIFWNPGWFAWYFVMAFSLAIGLLQIESDRVRRILAAGLLISYIYFFGNPQRGGLVALHLALTGFVIVTLARSRDPRLRIGLPVALAGIVLLTVSAFYFELVPRASFPSIWRLVDRPPEALGSNQIRANLWTAAVQMWQSSPLFGVGEGSFAWKFRDFVAPGSALDVAMAGDAHNTWLQLLSTRGLVGLAAYIFLLIALVPRLRAGLESGQRDAYGIALGLSLCVLTFVPYSFVQAMFYLQPIQVLFWAVIALSVVVAPPPAKVKLPTAVNWILAGAVVAALIAQIVVTRPVFERASAIVTREPRGFFPPYPGGPEGLIMRWSSRSGTMCLQPTGPTAQVRFLVSDPRVRQFPRTVTLKINGQQVDHFTIDTNDVVTRRFPAGASDPHRRDLGFGECHAGSDEVKLTVEVDRLWSPLSSGYGTDPRDLGVGVFEPRYFE